MGFASSPLTTILTSPCGTSRFRAAMSIMLNPMMTAVKTTRANSSVVTLNSSIFYN